MSQPDWREPQRRCLPLAEWPAADREGWLAATARGNLLLDDGPGALLKPVTLARHRKSYGRWLAQLERRGELDPESPPGPRATPERVARYIAELQAMNASGTVLVRLQSLAVVLRWLAPEQDWSWLRPALARLEAGVRPVRDKRRRLQLSDTLLELGERLMAEAEHNDASPSREHARQYRDGLLIAFLACHPLRLGNLIALEVSRHLLRQDTGWWLEIDGGETKNRRPIAMPLQARLAPALERYLRQWRPRLASPGRVARSTALWLTEQGRAISATHAHLRISRHTAAAFGLAVSPHGFRDAAATTIALTRPERIGIVTPLLGHSSIRTAQRHYNLAGMASAAEAWHEVLQRIERG